MTQLSFRRYPRNSPQAAGRILATALLADGDTKLAEWQRLAETNEKFVIAQRRRALRLAFFRIGKYEINIGGKIEFLTTELPQCQHDQLLRFAAG